MASDGLCDCMGDYPYTKKEECQHQDNCRLNVGNTVQDLTGWKKSLDSDQGLHGPDEESIPGGCAQQQGVLLIEDDPVLEGGAVLPRPTDETMPDG